MKKTILIVVICCLISCIYSCQPNGSHNLRSNAKGNRTYGGNFHFNERTPILSLYPYYIIDYDSYIIACQIYDGLVKFSSKDLSVVPDIAKSWDIDASGTIYTFHLRNDVFFQDDACFSNGKGRKVTANDFKYSMEKLCTETPENVAFPSTFKNMVTGADEYYENSKKGTPSADISGVKVLNDSTLEIKIIKKNPTFLYILAGNSGFVIAKEAVEKYGKGIHIGTGPFIYSPESDSTKLVLTANPNYFKCDSFGNRLPYLDTITISFISSKEDEFRAFKNGLIDYIDGVPSPEVKHIVEDSIKDFQHKPPRFVLSRVPDMSTQYYSFNLMKAPFNDIRVRKAFNLAINRDKIDSNVLQGEAFAPGIHGITPPSFMDEKNPDDNYDISKITGDSLNVDLARKLLKEAGFPDGKNFPAVNLELSSGGGVNTNVALEVQKELAENLNVNINLNIVSFSQQLDDEKYLKFDIIQSRWIADYPSPATFLNLFLGNSGPDSTNHFYYFSCYANPEYNKLIEMGRSSKSLNETYKYYRQAEQLMMNDAPILVLWYNENCSLVRGDVKGLNLNPLGYVDFSGVYFIGKNSVVTDNATAKP